jgi:MFS family permease
MGSGTCLISFECGYATRLPRPLPTPFLPSHSFPLLLLTKPSYAVDSLILLIQSIIAGQAGLEFKPSYANGLTIAAYVGMLVGALFWGISADVIGRKTAFNFSLLICSVFAIVAGASPSWEVLGLFVCLSSFGAGGNLVLDTAVFLEYLPSSRQWMLTLMAAWWGELWFCCVVMTSV